MLFYHAFDREVVTQASDQVFEQIASLDEDIIRLRRELLGPLGAGSMACKKENVPQLLKLLAIRKAANIDVDAGEQKPPLSLVFEDESQVPEKFSELGALFSLFEVSLEDVEEEAAALGIIPAKIDISTAFGTANQEANEASWF